MIPKIVFSDVDGTLADNNHQPIPADAPVIQAIVFQGVPVCLVSARPPQGLRPFQKRLSFTGPLVCFSGAYVLDGQGQVLISETIPTKDATEIYEHLTTQLPSLSVNTYGFEKWVVNDKNDPRVIHEEAVVHAQAQQTSDIAGEFASGGVHKFMLIGDPEEIRAAEQSVGARYPHLTVVRSNEYLCEITSNKASKAVGITQLCSHAGIDLSDSLAFGDGYNDLDMIKAAGRSFAMANAVPAVKEAATDICQWTNDESGVARTLAEVFSLTW